MSPSFPLLCKVVGFFFWFGLGFCGCFFLPIVKYAEMVMKGFGEILSVEVDVHVTLFLSYLLR